MADGFPRSYSGQGNLADFLAYNKAAIDTDLAVNGAALFRGFRVPDAEHFDAAVRAYGDTNFAYASSLSNAVRNNVTERVFTANEAPPEAAIFLHHEMAQTPIYPSKLMFYCETAPQAGGETPLCRSEDLLDQLQQNLPNFIAQFAELGVRYTNVMPAWDDGQSAQGRSWRSTLGVTDRAGAERRLHELGYSWEWTDNGALRATTPVLPAIKELPGGRRTFFNQLIAAARGWSASQVSAGRVIQFGDGSEIPAREMDVAIQLSDELTVDLQWEAGDVVLVDNYLVMHGRRPFKGKRRVLASLFA